MLNTPSPRSVEFARSCLAALYMTSSGAYDFILSRISEASPKHVGEGRWEFLDGSEFSLTNSPRRTAWTSRGLGGDTVWWGSTLRPGSGSLGFRDDVVDLSSYQIASTFRTGRTPPAPTPAKSAHWDYSQAELIAAARLRSRRRTSYPSDLDLEILEAQVQARLAATQNLAPVARVNTGARPGTLASLKNEAVRISQYADDAHLAASLIYENRSTKPKESVVLASLVTLVLVESGRVTAADKINKVLARRAGVRI